MWTAWCLAAARHAIVGGLSTAAVLSLSLPVRAAPSGVGSALEDTLSTAAVSSLRVARSEAGSPLKNAPRMRGCSVLVYLCCHTSYGCQLGFCRLVFGENLWNSNRACQHLKIYQVLFWTQTNASTRNESTASLNSLISRHKVENLLCIIRSNTSALITRRARSTQSRLKLEVKDG